METLALAPTAQARRVLDYFAGSDAQERHERLVGYASKEIKRRRWCIKTQDNCAVGGKQAEDIVSEAVNSLLSDQGAKGRRCLPDHVEVEYGLQEIICSKISHLSESAENRLRDDIQQHDPETGENREIDSATPFWEPSPDSELEVEEKTILRGRCNRFIEFVDGKGDKTVHAMLLLIKNEGIDKPAEKIASHLKIDVTQVFTARKRMKTLRKQFEKQKDAS